MDNYKGIKNIILDFGGVIIDVDYHRTEKEFTFLGAKNFNDIFNQARQSSLFDSWEIGEISENEFFSRLEKYLPSGTPREASIAAWNAMMGGFPKENYELLIRLKEDYRTFLLSNTNETHLRHYFGKLNEMYGLKNMDSFFEKTYYSNQIHMRKPNVEIFEHIIKENKLVPNETLFVDDSIQHVEGARKAGIQAHHLKKPQKLTELFPLKF
jgi:putative hydrolase of the HAD superfamily